MISHRDEENALYWRQDCLFFRFKSVCCVVVAVVNVDTLTHINIHAKRKNIHFKIAHVMQIIIFALFDWSDLCVENRLGTVDLSKEKRKKKHKKRMKQKRACFLLYHWSETVDAWNRARSHPRMRNARKFGNTYTTLLSFRKAKANAKKKFIS